MNGNNIVVIDNIMPLLKELQLVCNLTVSSASLLEEVDKHITEGGDYIEGLIEILNKWGVEAHLAAVGPNQLKKFVGPSIIALNKSDSDEPIVKLGIIYPPVYGKWTFYDTDKGYSNLTDEELSGSWFRNIILKLNILKSKDDHTHAANSDFSYDLIPLTDPHLKVLHFSTYHKMAGQSVAANRLCKGLYEHNIQSDMVVSPSRLPAKLPFNVHVAEPGKGPFGLKADNAFLEAYKDRDRSQRFHAALAGMDIVGEVIKFNPDVVQLHFINDGFVKMEDLTKIDKPIVWRLSDCWAFTGGCHFARECERYNIFCGKCPLLRSSEEQDISRKTCERKREVFSAIKDNLHVVTPAKWLYDKCRNSTLLADCNIYHIPNGLNTSNDYFPESKMSSRAALRLPIDKKIIMFGAENANNWRKGLRELREALVLLPNKKDYHFVAFGRLEEADMRVEGISCTCFGAVYGTSALRRLYSAADVFVCPSHVEPFGQVVTESLACGTPVVTFADTGPGSIVEHKVTGFVAGYLNIEELAAGIEYCANHSHDMNAAARNTAVNVYDIAVVTGQYKKLYENISHNNRA